MATSITNLRLLDRSPAVRNLDLASELFHRINRIIPEDQEILHVPPSCRVRDAVELMRKHKYSQVPVVEGSEVLGVFSYRSFAQGAANATLEGWTKQKCAPGDLQVDEFLEQFEFARVTEEMSRVFDAMDRDNGVLVGTPERLIGVLTPMDFLRYLHHVAGPFVLVAEIELAVRELMRNALTAEQIAETSKRCLSAAYGSEAKSAYFAGRDDIRQLSSPRCPWRLLAIIRTGLWWHAAANEREAQRGWRDSKRSLSLQARDHNAGPRNTCAP
jgi:predicted transcriptional regulator